jgi:hypothetical protein
MIMKSTILWALTAAMPALAQTSFYGTGGMNFVPGASVGSTMKYGGTFSSTLQEDPLRNITLSGNWLDRRLEVSLGGNAWLVKSDSVGWNPAQLPVPLVPSVKYVLDRDSLGRQSWAIAAGFSLPYGAYGAMEWRLGAPLVSPTAEVGLATPVRTVYAFAGLRLDLCDLEGRRTPVSLMADGALAGSTTTLGSAEESFWSLGVATQLGQNLSVQAVHRRDAGYAADAQHQNRQGRSMLRLVWNFDGAKMLSNTGSRP